MSYKDIPDKDWEISKVTPRHQYSDIDRRGGSKRDHHELDRVTPFTDEELHDMEKSAYQSRNNPQWIVTTNRGDKLIKADTRVDAWHKAEQAGFNVEAVSRMNNPDFSYYFYAMQSAKHRADDKSAHRIYQMAVKDKEVTDDEAYRLREIWRTGRDPYKLHNPVPRYVHRNPIMFAPVLLAAMTGAGAAAGSILATHALAKESTSSNQSATAVGTGAGVAGGVVAASHNPRVDIKYLLAALVSLVAVTVVSHHHA